MFLQIWRSWENRLIFPQHYDEKLCYPEIKPNCRRKQRQSVASQCCWIVETMLRFKRPSSGRISRWKARFIRCKVVVAFIARKRNGAAREFPSNRNRFFHSRTLYALSGESSPRNVHYGGWKLLFSLKRNPINLFASIIRFARIFKNFQTFPSSNFDRGTSNCRFNKWISVEIFLCINFRTFDSILDTLQRCCTECHAPYK